MIKRLTLAVLAGFWVFSVMLYAKLPARVATHFDIRGRADSWSDDPLFAWFGLPVLATFTVAFVYGIASLARRTPALWSLPKKKEFLALTPEQQAPILEHMTGLIDVVGLYTVTLMWITQYAVYHASTGAASSLPWFFHVALWGGLAGLLIKSYTLNASVKKMVAAASGVNHRAV